MNDYIDHKWKQVEKKREESPEDRDERLHKEKKTCSLCNTPDYPVPHYGSANCQSGSLASGGRNSHCTCDTCF